MKIYVLTRNENLYSSSRLMEAARYRGHEVMAVDYMQCYLVLDSGTIKMYYDGVVLEMPDVIIPRIGASFTDFGAKVIRHFEMNGVYTLVSADALEKSRDKFKCLQLLVGHGILTPASAFCHRSGYSKPLIEKVGGYPVIFKLLESTQGLGVVLAENKTTASSILDAFDQLDTQVLLQEYIEESKGEDIRVIVVGGKVVAAMKRSAPEGEFRSNIHRGGVGMDFELLASEKEMAIKAVEVLRLDVAGVDLLLADRGALVIEVNSSPGMEGIEKYSKKDVAQSVIKYIEDKIANS